MDTSPSTAEQHQAIRQAAQERIGFILWLAEKLEKTADPLIRKEAAKALRELVA
jgi:hypothetical protein